VTHKWLEDCFVEWRNLTPAQKKYLDYAAGVNYGTILGDRGVGRVGLEEDPELLPEIMEKPAPRQNHPSNQKPGEVEQPVGKTGTGEGGNGTATSMREALEVDEVEDVLHINGDPHGKRGDDRKVPPLSPTKFGPPHGMKKTPMKPTEATEHPSATPKSGNSVSRGPVKATGAARRSLSNSPSPPEDDSKLPAATPVKAMAAMKVGPPVKSKPKSKPISSTKPTTQRDNKAVAVTALAKDPKAGPPQRDEEHSASDTYPTKSRTASKPKPGIARTHMVSGSDQESTDHMRDKKRVKGKNPVMQVDTDDQSDWDVFMPSSKQKPKPTVYKSRARIAARLYAGSEEEDGDLSGADETPLRTKIKPGPKANKVKATSRAEARTVAFTSESGSDEEVTVLPLKKGARTTGAVKKSTPRAAPQPSPHRLVSVDLPDPRAILESTLGRNSFGPVTPASRRIVKPPKRESPVHVSTYEASHSSPRRGRPSAKSGATPRSPTPSPRRSPRHPPIGSTPTARKTIPASTSAIPSSVQRTPSRRTAAAAATQKLRDEVMPDVVNFENERKRDTKGRPGRRRKSTQSSVNDDDEEEEEESDVEVRGRKKRKIANDDDDESRDDRGATINRFRVDDSDAPARRFVTNVKTSKRPADPRPDKRNAQDGARKRARRERSASARRYAS
jgi:mediator of DNA damage checkpoint protein 1